MDFKAHARSCIAGALVGDACGSYCKFHQKELTEVETDFCMTMPGGGHFRQNVGQCSDEGELTMTLLQALVVMSKNGASTDGKLDLNVIKQFYKDWFDSKPFDIEETVAATIGRLDSLAAPKEKESQSNSSLVRITPLAVWAAGIEDLNIYRAVIEQEVKITHTDPLVLDASFIYAQTIAYLLNHCAEKDRALRAFEHAMKLSHCVTSLAVKDWLRMAESLVKKQQKSDFETLRSLNIHDESEFIKHSFVLAFYFLLRVADDLSYKKALQTTV